MCFGLLPIQLFSRISRGIGVVGEGGVVGSLIFDLQRQRRSHSDRQFKGNRGGEGGVVLKLDIFHGCHQCMVPNPLLVS